MMFNRETLMAVALSVAVIALMNRFEPTRALLGK